MGATAHIRKEREDTEMWSAEIRYTDGTSIERYFDDNPDKGDDDMQYDLECWLLGLHPEKEVEWYSVSYIYD